MSFGGAVMTLLGYLLLIVLGILLIFFIIAGIPAGLTLLAMDAHDKSKARQRRDRVQQYKDAMPSLEAQMMDKFRKSELTDEITDFILSLESTPRSISVNSDSISISMSDGFGYATVYSFEEHDIKPISENRVQPKDRFGSAINDVWLDYSGISECDALGGVLMERLVDKYPGFSVEVSEHTKSRGQSISRYFTIEEIVVKTEPTRSF